MKYFTRLKLFLLSLLGATKAAESDDSIENFSGKIREVHPSVIYISLLGFFCVVCLVLFNKYSDFQDIGFKFKSEDTYFDADSIVLTASSLEMKSLKNRVSKLDKAYSRFSNRQPYLIVNTSDNTFSLYSSGKLVREGLCSTGSFVLLDAGGEQKWMFETPKGVKRIQGKTQSPVWRKPDWAFIEEGLPVPKHANSFERYEYGVLGDYAMSIGNGYLIHGTLYQRLLGMPVTHGCVRLGDSDLEHVFHTLSIGSKVYIF